MKTPSCPERELICQACAVPLEVIVSRAMCPRCGHGEFDRLTCHYPATETIVVDGREVQRCPGHATRTE